MSKDDKNEFLELTNIEVNEEKGKMGRKEQTNGHGINYEVDIIMTPRKEGKKIAIYEKKKQKDILKEIELQRKIISEKLKEVNKTLRELDESAEEEIDRKKIQKEAKIRKSHHQKGFESENSDSGKLPRLPDSRAISRESMSSSHLNKRKTHNSERKFYSFNDRKSRETSSRNTKSMLSAKEDEISRERNAEERKKIIVDRVNESLEIIRTREQERMEEKERFKEKYKEWLRRDRELKQKVEKKEVLATKNEELDNKKDKILLNRKEMNKSVRDMGLQEHEEKYGEVRERLLKEKTEIRLAAKAKKHPFSPSYQSKFHDQTVEENKKIKIINTEKQNNLIQKKIKIKTFEKIVHESFVPKKDMLKELQLKRDIAMQEIKKLPRRKARKEVKEHSEDLIADYELVLPKEDPKKEGDQYFKTCFKKGTHSQSHNVSKILSEREKLDTSWTARKDYLKEMREKNNRQPDRKGISQSLETIKKVAVQKDIQPSEKYTIINAKLEKIEMKIAQNELLNKSKKNGQFQKVKERSQFSVIEELESLSQLDELYLESINAKLFLLKKL